MPSRKSFPSALPWTAASLISLAFIGCGGDGESTGLDTGSLTVSAATSGTSPDPDGYVLMIDGVASGTLSGSSPITTQGLAPGDHSVGLDGVAGNCQVQGENPRLVVITAGETASVTFNVVCNAPLPTTGTIQVDISTSGPDPDPDGYLATLDGAGPTIALPVGGSALFTDVPAGSHTVAITGVAGNCSADAASKGATVTAGATATVGFSVTCSAIPPETGTIRVTTTTTGPSPDPDGYQFSIDGGAAHSIGANGGETVNGVSAGSHSVSLTGVAANCTADAASKSATVTAGATATVGFTVTCTAIPPETGTIHVTTATTGPNPDPDGYRFAIDGGSNHSIGVNGSETANNVPAGAHTVTLSGIAQNCSVDGGASKSVTVSGGQTSTAAFTITCSAIQPSASRSTVVANPMIIGAGTGSSTVRVTVKGAGGELLSGIEVSLAATGDGNNIAPATATTNSSGVATFTFSSTEVGDKTITATAGGVTLDDTEVITVVPSSSTTEITEISPEPSTSGETIHVTVTVSGQGSNIPTGTVAIFSFDEGEAGCDAAPLNSEGIAVCDFALDLVTSHTIGATYEGDSQFEGSFDTQTHVVAP